MTSSKEYLEKILGGKIESLPDQPLPGLVPSAEEEVVYFSDDATADLGDQMQRLICRIAPPLPKAGRVLATKHTLRLPDGQLFHAIKYRGDIPGWRKQIEEGARSLGVVLGKIETGSILALTDGRGFALADCQHGLI